MIYNASPLQFLTLKHTHTHTHVTFIHTWIKHAHTAADTKNRMHKQWTMSNKIFKQAANRERGEEKAQSVEKTWIFTLFLGKGGVWYYVSPHMCRKVTLMLTFWRSDMRVRCSTRRVVPPPNLSVVLGACVGVCVGVCVWVLTKLLLSSQWGERLVAPLTTLCCVCETTAGRHRPRGLSLLWLRTQMGRPAEPWSRQLPAQAVSSCLFQSLPPFSEFYPPDFSPGRLFPWPLSESRLWSLCLFYKVAAVCNCFSDWETG